jgi:SSS family solute:Na+ symporter
LKPLASISLGEVSYSFYVGLGALILNTLVAAVVTAVMAWISPTAGRSLTAEP